MECHRVLLVALAALFLRGTQAGSAAFNATEEQDACGPGQEGGNTCLSECSAPPPLTALPEETVLILGNSGSGKSALAKLLSHHDDDMVAVQENNEYLIVGQGIGSRIASVTSAPALFRDNDTDTNYLDNPGFEDTRGTCAEVSATYYMKDVTRHARRVKVLLLTPHFAVRTGQDRHEFITMLKHAARVLRSPAKLEHSLALIVTKVDAPIMKVRGSYVRVQDAEVEKSVAAFLRGTVRPYLEAMAVDVGVEQGERDDIVNALKLLDNILADAEGPQSRIGLFHAPDEEGAVNKIEIVDNSRAALLRLVLQRLRYADVREDDFGFSVSPRTKVLALERARRLSADVGASLRELSAEAKNQSSAAYDPSDIRATQERFADLEKKAATVATRLKDSPDVQTFCLRVADHFNDKVAVKCSLLEVLQVVSDQPLVDKAVFANTWMAPLNEVTDYVKTKKDWYSFLLTTYQHFNSYLALLQRRPSGAVSPTLAIASLDFKKLLSFNATGQNMSDWQALLATVNRGPVARCEAGGRVVVEAESVLLSEAVSMASAACPGLLRTLELYALNTVFVDDSVRLPGAHLTIVAPRWEVHGSPKIDLDGAAGEPPGSAPWGAGSGERGRDGQPGNPGRAGGYFQAVGLEFVGGKVLVSARGGAGGAGQQGGAGGSGRSGGGNGGDGGDGGAGGLGGFSGKVCISNLGDERNPFNVAVGGGEIGPGGRGGLAGDYRPHTALRRRKRFVISSTAAAIATLVAMGGAYYYLTKPKPEPEPAIPSYHSGRRGADGVVSAGRRFPEKNLLNTDVTPFRMAVYFEHNKNHPYLKGELQNFLRALKRTDYFTDRVCL